MSLEMTETEKAEIIRAIDIDALVSATDASEEELHGKSSEELNAMIKEKLRSKIGGWLLLSYIRERYIEAGIIKSGEGQ